MIFNTILTIIIGLSVVNCAVSEQTIVKVDPVEVPTATPTPDPPRLIDFHVKNLRLGDSEVQVLEKLGKPKRRLIVVVDNCGITEILRLDYPGLEIQLDRDLKDKWFVLEIIVTSPDVPIEPKVSIGDDLETVRASFEKPNVERSNPEDQILYFLTKENDNAQFEFKKSKLSRVRFYVNPC